MPHKPIPMGLATRSLEKYSVRRYGAPWYLHRLALRTAELLGKPIEETKIIIATSA